MRSVGSAWCSVGTLTAVALAFAVPSATAGAAEQAASIERLPIDGMLKVTEADDSVKYLSMDRRFVFVGEMYDLWKGEALRAGVSSTQTLNLERNGVSLEEISFPVNGGRIGSKTLFVAPECEDCKHMLRAALELHRDDLNIVLLSSTDEGRRLNARIWCAEDRGRAMESAYLEGGDFSTVPVREQCDTLGLLLAHQASALFGIGQLPLFMLADGSAHTGKNAIDALTKGSAE